MAVTVAFDSRIAFEPRSDTSAVLTSAFGEVPLTELTPGLMSAFRTMSSERLSKEDLSRIVFRSDGIGALSRFNYHFDDFASRCLLSFFASSDGDKPSARLAFEVPVKRFLFPEIAAERAYQASRFAYCRRVENELVVQSPTRAAVIQLHDWRAAAVFTLLAEPRSMSEVAAELPGVSQDFVEEMFILLCLADVISPTPDQHDEQYEIATLDPLEQWEFHDLLFHTRSRVGRHSDPIGAVFPFVGERPAPASSKPVVGEVIELSMPPPELLSSGMTLANAIETRCSTREYGSKPIQLRDLGAFLYRVGRIRSFRDFVIHDLDGNVIDTLELSSRPYPSGGAIYEIEIYPVVHHCDGLAPGMYRYNPVDHSLEKVRDPDAVTERLVSDASRSAAIDHPPQVVLSLASRFDRMSWKYRTIAYAATLKHVGVIYQTMYLVATELGLAACALGSGNPDVFAQAAGTNYYRESTVGEFMLGSMPDNSETPKPLDLITLNRPNQWLPVTAIDD